ncbi:MAG: hypothetical protein ACD_4C00354G0004 [uncultured bacterium (gcode 4)]|uniref:ASCH domain-containing protein n=1 Tax=uncultured bacterium (gcode 4) TaxID=1234023 RepID=K2FTM8_9BACT|nr:MAG: hypothetical protein ACD_4C00354G0004 [uncultured bacterium (gcode 4)]
MKTLKFYHPLPEMILSWKKDITWRIEDEKNIQVWDELSFLSRPELVEFAKAKVLNVNCTKFWELKEEDIEWHEKFESEEEKYKNYSNYYKTEITPNTELKVIKFKLI